MAPAYLPLRSQGQPAPRDWQEFESWMKGIEARLNALERLERERVGAGELCDQIEQDELERGRERMRQVREQSQQ